jgi:hypothetical protein
MGCRGRREDAAGRSPGPAAAATAVVPGTGGVLTANRYHGSESFLRSLSAGTS